MFDYSVKEKSHFKERFFREQIRLQLFLLKIVCKFNKKNSTGKESFNGISENMSESGATNSKLTAAEKARISRNREKALQIRATKTGRLTHHPYAKEYVICFRIFV